MTIKESDDYTQLVIDKLKLQIARVSGFNYTVDNFIGLSTVYGVLSICYYVYNCSLVDDSAYDKLCVYLYDNYEQAISEGASVSILDKECLAAGTGCHLSRWQYLTGYAMYLPYYAALLSEESNQHYTL